MFLSVYLRYIDEKEKERERLKKKKKSKLQNRTTNLHTDKFRVFLGHECVYTLSKEHVSNLKVQLDIQQHYLLQCPPLHAIDRPNQAQS